MPNYDGPEKRRMTGNTKGGKDGAHAGTKCTCTIK